jgi:hypothetical protein
MGFFLQEFRQLLEFKWELNEFLSLLICFNTATNLNLWLNLKTLLFALPE